MGVNEGVVAKTFDMGRERKTSLTGRTGINRPRKRIGKLPHTSTSYGKIMWEDSNKERVFNPKKGEEGK